MQKRQTLSLAQQVRSARRSKKFSLRALAAKTDLSFGFLSELERGQRSCSDEVAQTIASALGLNLMQLMTALKRERVARLKARVAQQIAEEWAS